MAQNNSLNKTTEYLLLPQNGFAPTPDAGVVLAATAGDRPYINNPTDTFGLPLLNNGGGAAEEGDMMVGDSNGNFALVNIGGSGTVPTSNGTTWTWQMPGGGGGITWVEATGDLTMAAGNIYISNGASSNTFTLPATAAVGDTFGAYVGSQSFSIAQNSGQYILLAANQTTTGTGGSIDSGNSPGQGLQFTCITANETFMITAMSGGVTFN